MPKCTPHRLQLQRLDLRHILTFLYLLSPMGTPEKSPQFEIRRVENELDMEVNIGNRFKCWQ